jgi:hypothetical protein
MAGATSGLPTGSIPAELRLLAFRSSITVELRSPATGYTSSATLGAPSDVAVDSSGNVWVPNAFVPVTYANGNNIVEFVGAAVPVVTPISLAVKNGTIGARP